MTETIRKDTILSKVKTILTEQGNVHFLNQRNKIGIQRLFDGSEEHGILLKGFNPASLQKMIRLGFVSKLEMAVSTVSEKRSEIIDLSKLITCAMLCRQFNTAVQSVLYKSDLIVRWNRQNPKNPIDHKTKVNSILLAQLLQSNKHEVNELKNETLSDIFVKTLAAKHFTPEEKKDQASLCETYMDALDPFFWFLLAKNRSASSYDRIIGEIRCHVSDYLEKSRITEYLALMTVELLINIESGKKAKQAEGTGDPGSMFIQWRMNRLRREPGSRGRLQVCIASKETDSDFNAMRNKFYRISNADIREKSLKDFYAEATAMMDYRDLGLYYLSYLKESCKKVDIGFEAFVTQDLRHKQTLMNLSLTF